MHTTEDLVRQTAAFFIYMHKKKKWYINQYQHLQVISIRLIVQNKCF